MRHCAFVLSLVMLPMCSTLWAQACTNPTLTLNQITVRQGLTVDNADSRAVEAGDFNEDGYPDFVVVGTSFGIQTPLPGQNGFVFLADGAGGFVEQPPFQIGSPSSSVVPTAVVTADFNSDQVLDLAIADVEGPGSSNVGIFLGNGAGGFAAAPTPTLSIPGSTIFRVSSLKIADFNGDGASDIVIVSRSADMVSVFLGNGLGGFTLSTTLTVAAPGAATPNPEGVAVTDLDGDTNQDIIVSSNALGVSVWLGTGTGTFGAEATFPTFTAVGMTVTGGADPRGLATGDFDNDGNQDVAAATYSFGHTMLLTGTGTGTLNPPVATSPPNNLNTGELVAVDHNLDGNLDFATANFIASTTIGLGDGATNFATFNLSIGGPFIVGGTRDIATADFDLDGTPDYVFVHLTGGGATVVINDCVGPLPVMSLSQVGGPGTPTTIENRNLIVGNQIVNVFSLDLCPGGAGTGPASTGGLCVVTAANMTFINNQLALPVGSPPYNIIATAPTMTHLVTTFLPGTAFEVLPFDATTVTFGRIVRIIVL